VILSLFSGAGGLDLGFKRAGFKVAMAIDIDNASIRTHRKNFPATKSIAANLSDLGPSGLLELFRSVVAPGTSIGVIGGPPCQGFSRANPASRSDDPRNALPMLYLEIVEALASEYQVEFVLFENVLGLRDRKHSEVFAGILSKLSELGFSEVVSEYCALDFGVPQVRRRVIISGFRNPASLKSFHPTFSKSRSLTVRDAIAHLPEPAFFDRKLTASTIPFHPNHWTMNPRSSRFIQDGGSVRSGTRSFRQLDWDKPSPTVAYGHREIHVHPNGHRRLSVFEGMLLQGFPSNFVLEGTLSEQVQQVSNAVPPPMAFELASATRRALAADD
jgi:DNA (cytosine-5)-methyltransferase 1